MSSEKLSKKESTIPLKIANFGIIVGGTALTTAAVQLPLEKMMLNHIKNKQLGFPAVALASGRFAIIRLLYTGLGPHVSAGGLRATYITGGKKLQASLETTSTEATSSPSIPDRVKTEWLIQNATFTGCFAAGETIVTQYHDTKKSLIQLDLKFNTRSSSNRFVLGTYGLGIRYTGNLVNLFALCMIEESVANSLPFGLVGKHITAGAICGVGAGLITTPITYYKDVRLSQVVAKNGVLITPSQFSTVITVFQTCKADGWSASAKHLGKTLALQAPLKMVRSGAGFAIVSVITSLTSTEETQPLARIKNFLHTRGFFSPKEVKTLETPPVEETRTSASRK